MTITNLEKKKNYTGKLKNFNRIIIFTFVLLYCDKIASNLYAESIDNIMNFLPTSVKEMQALGWEQADVILFTGDAYIDHPAFGIAVIARVLESAGYRVAVVPQPNWRDDLRDFKKLGKPRLFFGISSGNMDSMVNHYTANKRSRSNDAYTPGGTAGQRPDYAVTIYSNIVKSLFPEVPIIIGGIEASLRRLTHYDYWSDTLKPSILLESKADILVYGMGEQAMTKIADSLDKGIPVSDIQYVAQTAYIQPKFFGKQPALFLFSHEECIKSKTKFAANFKNIEEEANSFKSRHIVQKIGNKHVIANPTNNILTTREIDKIYELSYTRLPHPRYSKKPPIPAYDMIRNSITSHRGCFGGCSFCTIVAHQGKFISSRSAQSILKEVDVIASITGFKGHITDIGGPSANMYRMGGRDKHLCEKCKRPSCIYPVICKNLNTSHTPLIDLYKQVSQHKSVKKLSIGSGIRYDLFYGNKNEINLKEIVQYEYIKQLITNHISGRLKVAPEHTSEAVLKIMRKPSFKLFRQFNELFHQIVKANNMKIQLIPYFISSHPGCTETDMAELAVETKKLNFRLEQVQDYTPTPMTLSSVMYYTGIHPYTLKKVYVPRSKELREKQRMFFFWYKSQYKNRIKKELRKSGKSALVNHLFGQ